MKRILFIFLFVLSMSYVWAQAISRIEELEKKVREGKDDTAKVTCLIDISNLVGANNYKKAMARAIEALELSKKIKYYRGIANAYSAMADAFWYHADFVEAQKHYYRSYMLNDSIHYERGTAMALYNLGWMLVIQQQNYKEDSYLYRAMGILQKLRDTSGLLQIYNAMGSYYKGRFGASKHLSRNFFDSALKYYDAGIKVGVGPKNKNNIGRLYSNLSDIYSDAKDYKSALYYVNESSSILLGLNDTASYMISCLMRGRYMSELKQTLEAKEVFEKVDAYSAKHEMKQLTMNAKEGLAKCLFDLEKYKESYQVLSEYAELNQVINEQLYSTTLKEMEGKSQLEKSEASVKELKQEGVIQELKNKQNTYFIFILLAVALIVITVAGLLFRQNKLKNEANVKLTEQNIIISEKKKEIDNSIKYAKGIQNAVLPDLNELNKHVPESFVVYHPKDVVSGDFYWFSEVGNSGQYIIVAADCTGHGVPGALMSIVSMDKLNQAVFEKKITEPGAILSFLNIEIKKALKQHSEEAKQKDGLDIALLMLSADRTKVIFSGANRPLYLVRSGKLTEFKPDKVAIAGFTPNEHRFMEQEISLQKNDCLYLSSDGYADQFGGKDSKKFMTKNFKSLLESVYSKAMAEQRTAVEQSHQQWKGNYEQVDDILVIGLKI